MDKALRTVPGIQKALSKHSLLDDDEEGDDDDDILQWEGKTIEIMLRYLPNHWMQCEKSHCPKEIRALLGRGRWILSDQK